MVVCSWRKRTERRTRVHPLFASALAAICVLIGPISCEVPRTGARPRTKSSYNHVYFPEAPQWITSLVFSGDVLWITYKENSRNGCYRNANTDSSTHPLLDFYLGAVLQPNATCLAQDRTGLFAQGFKRLSGHGRTRAPLLAGVVMKGAYYAPWVFKRKKDQFRMMFGVGIVAFILLALMYSTQLTAEPA